MAELVHECRVPGIQLDALDVVQDLGHQTGSRVLVLHLSDLQLLHHARDNSIKRNHENHDTNTGEHARSNELVEGDHAQGDLEGG